MVSQEVGRDGEGKRHASNLVNSTLFIVASGHGETKYLSQIYCTDIFGPCNFVPNIANNININAESSMHARIRLIEQGQDKTFYPAYLADTSINNKHC